MINTELQAYQAAAWATAIYPDKGQGTSLYPYLKLCDLRSFLRGMGIDTKGGEV